VTTLPRLFTAHYYRRTRRHIQLVFGYNAAAIVHSFYRPPHIRPHGDSDMILAIAPATAWDPLFAFACWLRNTLNPDRTNAFLRTYRQEQ